MHRPDSPTKRRTGLFRRFETLVDPFPATADTRPPAQLLPFLWHYARPLGPWLALMALGTAAISVVELTFMAYLGRLVDVLSGADRATFFATHGTELALMAAVAVLIYPAIILFTSLLEHQTVFGNFPMLARWRTHRYLLGQSLSFFQDEFAGRISQKVMQTALATREVFTKTLDALVYVTVYFTGAVVLTAGADWRLTLPLIVWLAAYAVILRYFVPRLRDVSRAQADARAVMTGRVVDSYSNIHVVKLFAHARRELAYGREGMEDFLDTVHDQMRLVTRLTVTLQTVNALLLASIAALAIYAWYIQAIGLGAIAVAIALVMRIRSMSDWVLWEVAGLFENIGTVQDGINTISRDRAVTDAPGAVALTVPRGEVRFENVAFRYNRRAGLKEPGVMDDLSLTIAPGEKVGLVGRSGAGKSTLVNLLLRFYDLDAGRITIDGQDIAGVTQESLRRNIGVVTQDTALLHRSLRENVTYGRPDATEAEIHAALARARVDEFLPGLVDQRGRSGLDAHTGERGVKLSGGQRQRVAIARVLLKDAPILVLDEATSALDSEVEAAIQAQLYDLMEGKTVIAIAHRLSTIAAMDRIVVMEAGRIVEEGSHDDLLAREGLYARLWARQSGGFLDTEAAA